jgi:hypothetical protein
MTNYDRLGHDLCAALEYNTVTLSPCETFVGESGDTLASSMVKTVLEEVAGENDGADWLWLVRLEDGRIAFVWGGCDYTGWDCQSNCAAYVGSNKKMLRRWAMTAEQRERFDSKKKAAVEGDGA